MTPAEIALANILLSQGLAYWSAFEQRKQMGVLTQEDLEAASSHLGVSITELESAIKAQKDALDAHNGLVPSTPAAPVDGEGNTAD